MTPKLVKAATTALGLACLAFLLSITALSTHTWVAAYFYLNHTITERSAEAVGWATTSLMMLAVVVAFVPPRRALRPTNTLARS